MPRGGARKGRPGAPYPNRTDMASPPKVATGGQYGDRQAALERMEAVPIRRDAGGSQPAAPATGATAGPTPAPMAPPTGLTAPTAFPGRPVTHGLSTGPGADPEVMGQFGAPDGMADVGAYLRALYAKAPNNDLLALIEDISRR